MSTRRAQRKTARFPFATAAAIALAAGAWLGHAATADADPVQAARLPVRQQIGYAGQLGETVTGQYPVVFRLFTANNALAYEETITADVRHGRFWVYVGSVRGDLRDVLRDSRQMSVFFEGKLLDSLPVIHADKQDVLDNRQKYSNLHAVVLTDQSSEPAITPQSLAGACSIAQTGLFTIPGANTLVGFNTPSCAPGVAVSAGYLTITSPGQVTTVTEMTPQSISVWTLTFAVGAAPVAAQLSVVCCP
jgi:hypothetical protein